MAEPVDASLVKTEVMPDVSVPPAYSPPVHYHQPAPPQPAMQTMQIASPPPVMTQPFIHQPTTTIVNVTTGSMEAKPPYPQRVNGWTTGLCDCFSDINSCLMGTFCTPCFGCQVSSHMEENCCTVFCCGVYPLRVKLRTQLGIRGTVMDDGCTSACCPLCALCQLEREMKNWGI